MIDAGSGAVGDGKVACVVRRRVGKGIQDACAPMAERWAGALLRRGLREQRVEQSEISEHSEHSEGLALFLGEGAA